MKRPIKSPPSGLRQRQRANGTWRIWWEPNATQRALGFKPADLDPDRLTWSVKQAEHFHRLADAARAGDDAAATRLIGRSARDFSTLIGLYVRSPEFDQLAAATKTGYRGQINAIREKWGATRVTLFTRPMAKTWYEALYWTGNIRQAQFRMAVLSILMKYAMGIGWIDANPCTGLRIATPKARQRIATWPEIDALFDAAAQLDIPAMGLAMALSVFNGQRATDCITARIDDFTVTSWNLTRSKNGTVSTLPLHDEVLKWMPAARAVEPQTRALLLVTPGQGVPFTLSTLDHYFARLRDHAARTCPSLIGADARDTLQFRDLRRTFAHLMRRAGIDGRDRADALGNTSDTDPRLSQTYNPHDDEGAARAIRAIIRPSTGTN